MLISGFRSMKRLEVFLLLLYGRLFHREVAPPSNFLIPTSILRGERGTVRARCLAQEPGKGWKRDRSIRIPAHKTLGHHVSTKDNSLGPEKPKFTCSISIIQTPYYGHSALPLWYPKMLPNVVTFSDVHGCVAKLARAMQMSAIHFLKIKR